MKQQPFYYYSSRSQITNVHDISQYKLKNGSIFLSNSDADRGIDCYPTGFVYQFKIKPIPRSSKFVKDTSDFDLNKILQMIRLAPTYQQVVQNWQGEQNLVNAVLAKSRQGAIYHRIFEEMYIDHELEYAQNMSSLGWVGFAFKVTEPDMLGGGTPNHIKTVIRIWNPDFLELLNEEVWDTNL